MVIPQIKKKSDCQFIRKPLVLKNLRFLMLYHARFFRDISILFTMYLYKKIKYAISKYQIHSSTHCDISYTINCRKG